MEIITRQELLKYLLTIDRNKVKNSKVEKNIELIYEKYPIAKKVQSLFKDFHDVMFSASPNNLDEFIKTYQDDVTPFCNGLKKDIAPIKNAISYEINSGFVEGNNNKFKLIKRIVYGKSKLCNLLKRSYISFMSTLDDFDISTIVEDILAS
ncbi:MAG: transposase [bacterium]|nr:transposase [bacterium]